MWCKQKVTRLRLKDTDGRSVPQLRPLRVFIIRGEHEAR